MSRCAGTTCMVVLLGFFTLCTWHGNAMAAPKTLTIVLEDKEDYPNVVGDGERIHEKLPGIAIEMVKMVGQRLNMKVLVKRMPWKRCLDIEIKQGKADGVIPISYSKEREEIGAYPLLKGGPNKEQMFSVQSYMFYKLRGSSIDWNGSSIKHFTGVVGAPPGYSIIEHVRQMGLPIEEGFTLNNMRKLASERIHLVASLEQEGDQVLATHPDLNKRIVKLAKPIVTKPYYLMLSHQFVAANPDLARKIWETLKMVREQEYGRLIKKYY